MSAPTITLELAQRARAAYRQHEPRDLFYKAALELVSLALDGRTNLSVPDAISVLLQTWNSSYYRFRGGFTEQHYSALDAVLGSHLPALRLLRTRDISMATNDDANPLMNLFTAFELQLGPVGAAKALHLIAPSFLPLWDRTIASNYGIPLSRTGTNAAKYWQMLRFAKYQADVLVDAGFQGNPLKVIDEFNYCRFVRHWL